MNDGEVRAHMKRVEELLGLLVEKVSQLVELCTPETQPEFDLQHLLALRDKDALSMPEGANAIRYKITPDGKVERAGFFSFDKKDVTPVPEEPEPIQVSEPAVAVDAKPNPNSPWAL